MANSTYNSYEVAADVNILKRSPFEGIPMTLDFTNVTDKDSFGNLIVKAGTPIGDDGEVDNTATVVGILLHDVIADRPQGTLLKKAYINETVAEAHSGITYADGVKTALPMVVFE